jgi:putative ABC transport system ATP-binding protein
MEKEAGQMIKMKNVSLVFGDGTPDRVEALKNISFSLSKNDFVTVIGSNGAGKSSLFNAVSGLHPPTGGRIEKNGTDITRWPEYKRASFIGRVFQDPLMGTAGNMSVQDNLTIASYKGMKKLKISMNKQKRSEYQNLLSQLEMGLEDRMTDNVGQLSGGQRQALTMLMMVLSSPDLVLLDEHTAALDPRNAAKVLELTDRFYGNYGLTVMMVTHNMKMALNHGNRLVMMDRGEIILEADGDEKSRLTVDELVKRFHDIRGENLTNDETLLS